jgi:NADH-quinone oxidoreductase subunit N
MNLARTESIFGEHALLAVSPLLSLTIGILLLLIAEIVPRLSALRSAIFAGTILAALWSELVLLRHPLPEPVFQGTYLADPVRAAWGMLFLASAALAWAFGRRYYRSQRAFLGEHDVLLLCTPIGMMLMAGAQDLVLFFVGLELLSVPLYCLAAFRRTRNESVEAGLKYFVLGAFAAATFLYGASLIYTGSGTLSLAVLRTRAIGASGGSEALVTLGAALVASSLFFKASVFPFHLWVPDVYQGSPTPVTALMATGTKAAAFAVLIGTSLVAPGEHPLLPASSATLVAWLSIATMVAGNLGALVQGDLKRMLAYSGVAHAGTLLLLVAAALAGPADSARLSSTLFQHEVMRSAIYYMAAYVFTAGGAFGLLSWLEADGEHFTSIASLRGLAGRRPGVAAGLALFMLSLGGIPATGGFLGKYFVFTAAVHSGMVGFAIAGVLTSVLALAYYLRVVVAMFMEPAPEGLAPPRSRRLSASLATAVCAGMVVLLGILPGIVLASF